MKQLTVHVTFHWYDEIKSGRKRNEYRANSKHWRRILMKDDKILHFDSIKIYRGYTSEYMICIPGAITFGMPIPEQCFPTDEPVFIIPIIEIFLIKK